MIPVNGKVDFAVIASVLHSLDFSHYLLPPPLKMQRPFSGGLAANDTVLLSVIPPSYFNFAFAILISLLFLL